MLRVRVRASTLIQSHWGPHQTAGFHNALVSGKPADYDGCRGKPMGLLHFKGGRPNPPQALLFVLVVARVVQGQHPPTEPDLGLTFGGLCMWPPGMFRASQTVINCPTYQMGSEG